MNHLAHRMAVIFLAAAASAALLGGCKKTPDATATPPQNIADTSEPAAPQWARYTPGTRTEVLRRGVGPAGGRLELTGEGPTKGISIEFPRGALRKNETVSVGYKTGQLNVRSGKPGALVLSILVGDRESTRFSKPLAITVPIEPGAGAPAPYFIDKAGRLHPLPFGRLDRARNLFTFYTGHASDFSWIYSSPPEETVYTTGFSPAKDGFARDNFENKACAGQCAGMSAFSIWYFLHNVGTGRHLREKYDAITIEDNMTAQDVIASRAQISYSDFPGLEEAQEGFTAEEKFNIICNAIYNTTMPVLVGIIREDAEDHAVTAYGYDVPAGVIRIYDPNNAEANGEIRLEPDRKSFRHYMGTSKIVFSGDHDFPASEPFEHILSEAEDLFHHTATARIEWASPANKSKLAAPDVTLTGTVRSGAILANRIKIWVTSLDPELQPAAFERQIGMDGAFTFPVRLFPGNNHLIATVYGTDCDGSEKEIKTFNNYQLVYEPLPPEPDEPKCDLKRIHASGAGWAEFQVSKRSGTPCWVGLISCSITERDGAKTSGCYVPSRRGEGLAEVKANCPNLSKLLLEAAASRTWYDMPVEISQQEENCYGANICSRIILCGD